MESRRADKVAALIQALVAEFFLKERDVLTFDEPVIVDGVFVSPDIKHAQIWLSFGGISKDKAAAYLVEVQNQRHELIAFLFKRVSLRKLPQLSFRLSDPNKAFKLMDIFDTLRGHARPDQSNPTDDSGESEDSPDDAH